jgi:hypothetical protein
MKRSIFVLSLFALLFFCAGAPTTWAQKPLKGNWVFTIQTPMGALPVPFSFKAKGKGVFTGPGGALPIVYREDKELVSILTEAIGLAPDGGNLSFLIRGTKTDSSVTANAIVVTDTVDASNPTGFAVVILPVSGKRQ